MHGLKRLLSSVAAVLGVLVMLQVYEQWQARPLRRFCHSLPAGAAVDEVIAAARKQPFVVDDMRHAHAAVLVSNQRAPFFRYTCRISLADGVLAERAFGPSD